LLIRLTDYNRRYFTKKQDRRASSHFGDPAAARHSYCSAATILYRLRVTTTLSSGAVPLLKYALNAKNRLALFCNGRRTDLEEAVDIRIVGSLIKLYPLYIVHKRLINSNKLVCF
jgi:hypothetical protein